MIMELFIESNILSNNLSNIIFRIILRKIIIRGIEIFPSGRYKRILFQKRQIEFLRLEIETDKDSCLLRWITK